jgi:proteic killer suppression protein
MGGLDRIPVNGIFPMIRSFSDKRTESLFHDRIVPVYGDIARRAKRKLEAIHAAARLDDLRVPPSNRLEKLKGNSEHYYSIRINDQWRVIFRWLDGDAYDVAIVDYH